jgi:hypothetical protein
MRAKFALGITFRLQTSGGSPAAIAPQVLREGKSAAVPLRHNGNWTANRGSDESFAKSRR